MNLIHDNKENNISEFNLLHNILNLSKLTKNINSSYYPILHGFMNTRRGQATFDNFRILFYSGCSSMIFMMRLITKIITKEDAMIQWYTQEGYITTNLKFKINLT